MSHVIVETKICTTCNIEKPATEFHMYSDEIGRYSMCKDCRAIARRRTERDPWRYTGKLKRLRLKHRRERQKDREDSLKNTKVGSWSTVPFTTHSLDDPYCDILMAIVMTAAVDSVNDKYREDVARFYKSTWYTYICDELSLSDDFNNRLYELVDSCGEAS